MHTPVAPDSARTGATAPAARGLRLVWPAASWHNIFFDLAFVAIVLVLSTSYGYDHTPSHTLWLGVAFTELWLLWLVTSMLERHVRMGFWRIAIIGAQMAVLLLAALSADTTIEDTSIVFGVLIGTATLLVLALDLAARDRRLRATDRILLVAAAVGSVMGTFELGGLWPLVWLANFAFVGLIAVRLVRSPAVADGDHLRHRLGELTLVVLGESFVKVGLTADVQPLSSYSGLGLLLVFALVTSLWWAYFTVPRSAQVHPDGRPSTRWVFVHLPFHLAVIALAVGLGKLLTDVSKLDKGSAAELVFVPIALATLAVAGMLIRRAPRRGPVALIAVGLIATGLAVWGEQVERVDARLLTAVVGALLLVAVVVAAVRRPGDGPDTAEGHVPEGSPEELEAAGEGAEAGDDGAASDERGVAAGPDAARRDSSGD